MFLLNAFVSRVKRRSSSALCSVDDDAGQRPKPGESAMKTDHYTRVVLTVIAACLVWICLRDVGTAHAAPDVADVRIVGIHPARDAAGNVDWQALPIEGTRGMQPVIVQSDPTNTLRVRNDPNEALWMRLPR